MLTITGGIVMPARDYRNPLYYKFWSGQQTKSVAANDLSGYDPTQGFIWPYLPSHQLNACPSWQGLPNNGQLGYGYNWMYFSYSTGPTTGGPWTFTWTRQDQIPRPAEKVMFADCARNVKTGPEPARDHTVPQRAHLPVSGLSWPS